MHPRVLVADSHPLFWLGVETAVRSETDIAVIGQAASADDLIAKMSSHTPNVVLVDTLLPGLHDAGTLKRVLTDIPGLTIMLDSLASPQCATRMIAAGAGGYLPKTCTREELINAIREVHRNNVHVAPVIACAMANGHKAPSELPTTREVEVMRLIAEGMNIKEIARRLGISTTTVRIHRGRLYKKLMVDNDVQLARYAFTHGYACVHPPVKVA